LPGFGRSPGPFTVAGAAEAIGEIIVSQPQPVHLCGLSLGGIVAVRLSALVPSRVAGLILTGTPVAPARDFPAALRMYRHLPGPLLRTFSDVRGRREWLQMISELRSADLRGYLPRITARTLVICGSRDRRGLPAARELAGGIAGGRLWIAPYQAHSWPKASPRLFGEVVTGFVAAAGSGPRATP
jgi:3-oxoadipate enol-lactonase